MRQQLAQTYAKPSLHKLTDRNIADLVLQLIQDSTFFFSALLYIYRIFESCRTILFGLNILTRFFIFIGDLDLIFTQDGLEYVTPKQLWREIEQEIADQGGRRTIFGLGSFLGVESSHVERLVARFATTFHFASSTQKISSDSNTTLVNADSSILSVSTPCIYFLADSNELIDSSYNSKLIRSLNEQLQANGIANVNDFASQRSLPFQYIHRLLQKCLEDGNLAECEYDVPNRTLVRPEFREKFYSILHAALNACTRPIAVHKLLVGWKGVYYTSSLINYAVERMQSEKSVSGTFSSKIKENYVFTPSIFVTARDTWVNNALGKNSHISFNTLQKLGFTIGSQEAIFRDNICLPNSIISPSLLDHLKSSIQEACSEQHILPLAPPLIPDELEENDLKALSSKIDLSGLGRLYVGKWFVPSSIEERCLQLFQQEVSEDARRRAEIEKQNADIISSSKPVAPEPISFTHANAHELVKKWLPSERKHEVALSMMTEKLLPQLKAMCAAVGTKSTSPVTTGWNSSAWLAQFESSHLNMLFFLKSIESLSTSISPEQRAQLRSHVYESLLPSLLQQLREACRLKFLLPTLPDEEFLKLVPSDVSKNMLLLMSGGNSLSLKKYSKVVGLLLHSIGLEAPILDEKVFETILATHRASAATQLQNNATEPSTKLRLALSLLQSKLKNAILLTTAKHLNLLVHITKTELKAMNEPLLPTISNQELITLVEASYTALLSTIRAKQTKNSETMASAISAFNTEIDKLIEKVL